MTAAPQAFHPELRRERRVRSILRGRVVYNGGSSAFDCVIRDLSRDGAKLEFSAAVTVPQSVVLEIPSRSERHQATVRWRQNDFMGLMFVDSEPGDWTPVQMQSLVERVQRLEWQLSQVTDQIAQLSEATDGGPHS